MIKVREAIVVEGRYDKNKLAQIFDALIIETSGFGIFTDREKLELLRRIAERRGLVILTDSDGAGFVIRNFLKGALGGNVKHAYIPDVKGKERRKGGPSKEGLLGVEGMDEQVLVAALLRAGVAMDGAESAPEQEMITKADFYAMGLSGATDSARRRGELLKKFELPQKLGVNAMLDVLNALMSRREFMEKLQGR